MSTVAVRVPPRPGEYALGEGMAGGSGRISATMVLSVLVHAMLLLGVGWAVESAAPIMPTLDVILTETTSPLTQKQADFLAQATNQGGGEHDKTTRPRETQSGPAPQPEPGIAPARCARSRPLRNRRRRIASSAPCRPKPGSPGRRPRPLPTNRSCRAVARRSPVTWRWRA